MEPIGVGIIGLGRSGRDIHAKLLAGHPGYRLAAIADADEAKRAAAPGDFGCAIYEDDAALLADRAVELAVITTPTHLHADIAVRALAAGKAVLVDKPLAAGLAEADRIIEAADSAAGPLTVFQNRRFDADFLKVREVIASGVLGPVQFIRRGKYSYSRRKDWQAIRSYGGGILNNWGAHLLDQVLLLLDYDVREVFGDARLTVGAGDAEDQAVIVLLGRSVVAQIDLFSCCAETQPEWLVLGKHGAMVSTEGGFRLKCCDPASLAALPEAAAIPPYSDGTYSSEQIEWHERRVDVPGGDRAAREFYDRLHAALRGGGPLPVRPEESRKVIQIIEQCGNHSAD